MALDEDTFERYPAELAAASDLAVPLDRVAFPSGLDPDFWLDLRSPDQFAAWAAIAVDRLADGCRRWVAVEELNARAYRGWFTGAAPPGRRGRTGDMVRALGNLLTAHVLASRVVARRQPGGTVGLDLRSLPVYELSGLLADVVAAPALGVHRQELRAWLAERRRAFYAARPQPRPFERVLRAAVASAVPLDQAFPRAVGEAYADRPVQPTP